MRHTWHSEQWLPHPVEYVFAFFANPENLPRLMPAWQKARIEEAAFAPPPPRPAASTLPLRSIAAGAGTRMTISFRPFPYAPLRVPWEAQITDFVWNDHFCDHQLRGPFAFWHHCHSVRPEPRTTDSGSSITGTLLHDDIEYEIPFGQAGELARRIFISHQLRSTFSFRHARTQELLALMSPRT